MKILLFTSLFLIFPVFAASNNLFTNDEDLFSFKRPLYKESFSVKKSRKREYYDFASLQEGERIKKKTKIKNDTAFLELPNEILLHILSFTRGKDFDNLGLVCKKLNEIQNHPYLLHLKSIPYLSRRLFSSRPEEKKVFFKADRPLIIKRLKRFSQKLNDNFISNLSRKKLVRNWKAIYQALTMAGQLGDKEAIERLESFKRQIEWKLGIYYSYIREDCTPQKVFKLTYVIFAQYCYFSIESPEKVATRYEIPDDVLKYYKKHAVY